jgi:hypothetical protein
MSKKFNLNDNVLIKLTDRGRQVLKEQHEQFNLDFPSMPDDYKKYRPLKEDINGYSKWQLWVLMEKFGTHIHIGMDPLFETEIILK